ncbi:hypothetical protein P171DRAFT_186042 [Karstenula rhodostoma CBS 690.94]|uniref:Uncharacterized protein n=1 Tax=Karstenula rhodostoma CBS 690.94 TaxID=1392251 RepID=A0A9P4UH06_9PLEO|nr:hypothetical protein P171DRAFT_186042 [Karstenula rhodostoma CBS 690.94]
MPVERSRIELYSRVTPYPTNGQTSPESRVNPYFTNGQTPSETLRPPIATIPAPTVPVRHPLYSTNSSESPANDARETHSTESIVTLRFHNSRLSEQLLKTAAELAENNAKLSEEVSRLRDQEKEPYALLSEARDFYKNLFDKRIQALEEKHRLDLEGMAVKYREAQRRSAAEHHDVAGYMSSIKTLEQKVDDLEGRNTRLGEENAALKEKDQISRVMSQGIARKDEHTERYWQFMSLEMTRKDEQMERYWQFLGGNGYDGKKSGLSLTGKSRIAGL